MTQSVLQQALKYDGSIHYEWQAQLEYQRHNLIILYTHAGTPYGGRRSGVLPFPFRTYLWTDRWFNIEQIYLWDSGRGIRHYINIIAPASFDGRVASYIDLDLDIDVDNQWTARLLDEEEYAAHSLEYDYPPHVKQNVERAVETVRGLIQSRAWPLAACMESERLFLRPFFWSDLAQMDAWQGDYTPFDDPWVIPPPHTAERHDWYSHYIETPVTRLYAIETRERQMIGHLSLREIVVGSQARLGIGFAPDQVGKGYGAEALRAFLPYYFDVLGFERMVLDVAATNVRALRSYQKVGFRRCGEHHRSYGADAQWQLLDQPQYAPLKRFFRRTPWGLQQLFYDMEMTRGMWQAATT